ncbi:peptidoglycan DD-metalloendopeptidase family protein [Clostridium sp. B9]|uniref:peptidoglycan DD-metalloendopeptidase family protein n=1 Tax=Clostridium sp. B9 TaxID=3423224 RepID=UPI003D2E9F3F
MNKKEQLKRFIKKDGFYVVLFVCLCLIATVGVVVANKSANDTVEESVAENNIDNPNEDSATSGNTFDDAELVDNNTDENEEETTNEAENIKEEEEVKPEANNEGNAVATSNQSTSFIAPVKDGVITRGYNLEPRLNESGQSASVYKGIDIEVADGAEVLAIGDGKVVEAGKGNSKEGCFVKIEHQNGVVGFYANLDSEIKVKEGDTVKKGTPIGKVGNTIQNSPSDRVSKNYLMFHMENSKEPVDPQKYLKDIPVKE